MSSTTDVKAAFEASNSVLSSNENVGNFTPFSLTRVNLEVNTTGDAGSFAGPCMSCSSCTLAFALASFSLAMERAPSIICLFTQMSPISFVILVGAPVSSSLSSILTSFASCCGIFAIDLLSTDLSTELGSLEWDNFITFVSPDT